MKLTGNKCRCGACGAHFLTVAAFDKHRVGDHGDRACNKTADLPGIGLEPNPQGFWRFPVMAAPKGWGWKKSPNSGGVEA